MRTDDPAAPASGSVPHSFRNALFWKWAPAMPKGTPSGFLSLLYALAAAADPAGVLRFRTGEPIQLKDIAKGARADEKDTRRYLNAAMAAGVVVLLTERRRGRTALYALALHPRPDWEAAAASLSASRRQRTRTDPPPWQVENGGPAPGPPTAQNGAPAPVLPAAAAETERGTAPRTGTGDRPPTGTGDRPPDTPGGPMSSSHERAEDGEQPQDAREHPDLRQGARPALRSVPGAATDPTGQRALLYALPEEQRLFNVCGCGNRLIPRPGRPPRTHCALCAPESATTNHTA